MKYIIKYDSTYKVGIDIKNGYQLLRLNTHLKLSLSWEKHVEMHR